jgi:phosphoribosylanthranilate isomerase
VVDTYDPAKAGGTGTPFPWDWVAAARDGGARAGWPPIILAGGLRPENVAEAIREVRPYGVDVSSGVELAGTPGRKDVHQVKAFISHARRAFDAMGEPS